MSETGDALQRIHEFLKEALLDALYRVERLEELRSVSPSGVISTLLRLPSMTTTPDMDDVIRSIEVRLDRLEEKFGE